MLTSLLTAQASDRDYPYNKEHMRFDYSSDVHGKQTFVQDKETIRELTDGEYEQIEERERKIQKKKDDILQVYTQRLKDNCMQLTITEMINGS